MDLTLRNYRVSFAGRQTPILDVKLAEFPPGMNFVIGRNGAGKSTLLRSLAGSHPEVIVEGEARVGSGSSREVSRLGVGIVTQRASDSIFLELTLLENLLLAQLRGFHFLEISWLRRRSTILDVKRELEPFGVWGWVDELARREAQVLSAGQQQLLAILMRLVRVRDILLLDECTASLDAENSEFVLRTLQFVASRGTVVLFVTHQLEVVEKETGRVYEIVNGGIRLARGPER